MAHRQLTIAIGMIVAASPVAAASFDSPSTGAPTGGPATLYCMHVDPVTGSNVQTIQCWTRDEWADQGVDVDREWAKNGVRTLG
jgi:hypothetical protein